MTEQLCFFPHQPEVASGSQIRQVLMVELFIFIVCIGIAVISIYLKVSDVTIFVSDKYDTYTADFMPFF